MPLNLPRLPRNVKLTDANGQPTQIFQQWWQTAAKAIEAQFGAVDAAIAAQAAADAANTAAEAANTAAETAQDAADAVTAESNLVNSYVTGTPPILTATDAGANVTITIAAHSRVYGDGTTVSVTGGNLTGLSYSTTYYIYYDQASRAGGAVTFVSTTTGNTAAQTGDRHLVGSVLTPAAAGAPVDGDYVAPPGIGSLYDYL